MRRSLASAALVLLAPAVLLPTLAHAQAVERNLPQAAPRSNEDVAVPEAAPSTEDATPIGPILRGVVLLGPRDEPLATAAPGVDASRVARLAKAPDAVRRLLALRLGQPLSRKLIGDIQADIVRLYRDEGFPFVALSTPPQELTEGVLQVRVVEFLAGAIKETHDRSGSEPVVDRVRQKPGQPIDALRLNQDLDWLNRNPFRNVRAVFSPGEGFGLSDVTLTVSEARPWRAYGGVFTSDSPSRGDTRWYAGVQAAPLPFWPDAIVSYQFTGSDDALKQDAAYRSHAGSLDLGLAPRLALEATADVVDLNQSAEQLFNTHLHVAEGALGVRFAAFLGRDLPVDLRLGVETRRARRTLSFDDIEVFESRLAIVQLYAGAQGEFRDKTGRTLWTLTAHHSPGGVGADNDAADFLAYSEGRVAKARYSYLEFGLTHVTPLGRLTLVNELSGRAATGALPDTEQMGLGGYSLVRGYGLEDGAFDNALVVRNTLNLPGRGRLQPFAFADAGYGEQTGRPNVTAISLGGGGAVNVTRFAGLEMTLARAMRDGPYTMAGDWRLAARLRLNF